MVRDNLDDMETESVMEGAGTCVVVNVEAVSSTDDINIINLNILDTMGGCYQDRYVRCLLDQGRSTSEQTEFKGIFQNTPRLKVL